MAETRLTMKLIKATHATDIAAALAATSENGGEVKTEAAAVSELSALRLSGLGLRAIENLEPFDRCEALYLDHNEMSDIEVPVCWCNHSGATVMLVSVFFFNAQHPRRLRTH